MFEASKILCSSQTWMKTYGTYLTEILDDHIKYPMDKSRIHGFGRLALIITWLLNYTIVAKHEAKRIELIAVKV